MSTPTKAEALARQWIELWNEGRPDDIPLADDFVHVSPFGRMEGRSFYLETVKPMAAQNVADLRILETMGDGERAVVRFDMHTPQGVIPVVDWVTIDGDTIREIHSFYDATALRG